MRLWIGVIFALMLIGAHNCTSRDSDAVVIDKLPDSTLVFQNPDGDRFETKMNRCGYELADIPGITYWELSRAHGNPCDRLYGADGPSATRVPVEKSTVVAGEKLGTGRLY